LEGKSSGNRSSAETGVNGEVAPIPAIRGTIIEPLKSTQLRHWPRGVGASTMMPSAPQIDDITKK
jgi:hypothetical protein